MLKKIQNRSGASPQPCFVPFDTSNSGERSPFSIFQPPLLLYLPETSLCCASRRSVGRSLGSIAFVIYTYTHPFNGRFSRTTQVSRYQKGRTNLDFTEARDSEWQWHQLGRAICKSAPCSRQITTPASHHSVFYRPDALPAAQPTASKH